MPYSTVDAVEQNQVRSDDGASHPPSAASIECAYMQLDMIDRQGGSDRYQRMDKVGKGSFATCYRGVCIATADPVCLKVIDLCNRKVDPEDVRNELQFLSELAHDHIMPIYAHNISMSLVVTMAIEFCPYSLEGIRVADDEDESVRTRLHHKLARKCVAQVAMGMAHLHASNIVHCDIKPGNIMCTPRGVLKLADFVLAMSVADGPITDGVTRGTEQYMSPEMNDSKPYNVSTDVWSLAIMLYELTFGVLCRPLRPSYERRLLEAVAKSGLDKSSVKRPDGTSARASKVFARFFAAVFVEDPKKRLTAADIVKHQLFQFDAKDCARALTEELKLVVKLKLARSRAKQEYHRTGALETLELESSSDSSESDDEGSSASSDEEDDDE